MGTVPGGSFGCSKPAAVGASTVIGGGPPTTVALALYAKPLPSFTRRTCHSPLPCVDSVQPPMRRSATGASAGSGTTCSTKLVSMRDGGTAFGNTMVPTLRTRVPGTASDRTATLKLTLRGCAGGTTGSVHTMARLAGSNTPPSLTTSVASSSAGSSTSMTCTSSASALPTFSYVSV